jgi:hypothetical protein
VTMLTIRTSWMPNLGNRALYLQYPASPSMIHKEVCHLFWPPLS